ncbi:flocculation protein FLO11 isoform X2 [Agrilus planipennis]|uniref:Flocculation protein FLO11 isoform X1 n=1 Tax=Agrilus planipennis TaxID=224129 RepID=A0A1W4X751_AGRPL|nr:flocculation protein FLO11 isoform X1 [Agrilus planipennis]XP_025835390.1 flocculation protein FLO11 isoform X2 [Agrilus planipennis]
MTFNDTEILDDDDHDSKEEKDSSSNSENSNSIKTGESDEKQDTGDENNSKEVESEVVQNITTKSTIPYDLPPKQAVLNKNESRTTVLTNSIVESKLKNIKKDPFIPTYSPTSEDEPNKERIDQYLLTDTNKPILIEKRGRIIGNSNNTRSASSESTTRNSSNKIDKVNENENVISYLGSTTTKPLQNIKTNSDMNETETNHFISKYKKDLVTEPVTNNYINSDLDSGKTTTTKIGVTATPVNATVENNRVDIKTHNLITITTGNATTTLPLNHPTSTESPPVTVNDTNDRNYETTSMISTTTLEPEVTSTEITTVSDRSTFEQSEEQWSSSTLTTTVDDGIFSYTTADTDTPSTTATSEDTTIITNGSTTILTSTPNVDIRSSSEIDEATVSYTTQISVSSSFSVSAGKKVNVTLSKETLEDVDGSKDEIESKEVIDDDDDDIYDAPTTVSSSNDLFSIDKDHVGNDTWAKYENNTEERAVRHNSTSTLPTTIEILHVASVGSHQTTYTPETFQPDHSYQTPQLIENGARNVGAFTEIEEPFEATTIAGSHEMGSNMDGNGATIAAIVISCIGAVCLLLLAGLLIIIKRRHKRFNYGQRCTPVSLDAYSVDNVSVYNSVSRRKGIARASKRSYGNPAFDDSVC